MVNRRNFIKRLFGFSGGFGFLGLADKKLEKSKKPEERPKPNAVDHALCYWRSYSHKRLVRLEDLGRLLGFDERMSYRVQRQLQIRLFEFCGDSLGIELDKNDPSKNVVKINKICAYMRRNFDADSLETLFGWKMAQDLFFGPDAFADKK